MAKLSSGQAMYHFISGYTAKVAGTERGITEPTPNFSACFGAAFLTIHPTKYADLLQDKLEKHGATAFLVNTGWSGGAYGVGERMSIKTTRAAISAILNGSIHDSSFKKNEVFGFEVPTAIEGIEPQILDPRNTWEDKSAFDDTLRKLGGMFVKNFEEYSGVGSTDYTQYGPQV